MVDKKKGAKPQGKTTFMRKLKRESEERAARLAVDAVRQEQRVLAAEELLKGNTTTKFPQEHVNKVVGGYDKSTVEHLVLRLSPAKRIKFGNATIDEQNRMIFEVAQRQAKGLPRAGEVSPPKFSQTHIEGVVKTFDPPTRENLLSKLPPGGKEVFNKATPGGQSRIMFEIAQRQAKDLPRAGDVPHTKPKKRTPKSPAFKKEPPRGPPLPTFEPPKPAINVEALRTDCKATLGVQDLPKSLAEKISTNPETIQRLTKGLTPEVKLQNLQSFLTDPKTPTLNAAPEVSETYNFREDVRRELGVIDTGLLSKINPENIYAIQQKLQETLQRDFQKGERTVKGNVRASLEKVLENYPTLEDELGAKFFDRGVSGVIEVEGRRVKVEKSGFFDRNGIQAGEEYKVKAEPEVDVNEIRKIVRAYSPRKQKKFAKKAKKELLKLANTNKTKKVIGKIEGFSSLVEYVNKRVSLDTPQDIEDAAVIGVYRERLVTKRKGDEVGLPEIDKDPIKNQFVILDAVVAVKGITQKELEARIKDEGHKDLLAAYGPVEPPEDESKKITKAFEKALETKLSEAKTEAETQTPAVLNMYEHERREFFKSVTPENFMQKLEEFFAGPLAGEYVNRDQLEERLSERLKVYDDIYTLIEKNIGKIAKAHISTEVREQLAEEVITKVLAQYLEDPENVKKLFGNYAPEETKEAGKAPSKKASRKPASKKASRKPASRKPASKPIDQGDFEEEIRKIAKKFLESQYVTDLLARVNEDSYKGFVGETAKKVVGNLKADGTIRDEVIREVRKEVKGEVEKGLEAAVNDIANERKLVGQNADKARIFADQAKESSWFAKYGKAMATAAAATVLSVVGWAYINQPDLKSLEDTLAAPVKIERRVEEVVSQPIETQPKEVVSQPIETQPKRRVVTRDASKRLYIPNPRGRGYKLIELVKTPEGEKMLIADGKRFCTVGDIDKDPDGPIYFEEEIAKELKRLGKVPEKYKTRKIAFRTENYLHGPDTNQDGQPDLVDNKGHTYESLPGNKNIFTERRRLARK